MKQLCCMLMIAQCFLLSGCFSCLSSWCLGEETYERLRHPKGLGEYWEKPGMTKDSWRVDWVECGGRPNGDYSTDTPPMSTHEIIKQANDKKLKELWLCMTEKGYHFTGKLRPAW